MSANMLTHEMFLSWYNVLPVDGEESEGIPEQGYCKRGDHPKNCEQHRRFLSSNFCISPELSLSYHSSGSCFKYASFLIIACSASKKSQ